MPSHAADPARTRPRLGPENISDSCKSRKTLALEMVLIGSLPPVTASQYTVSRSITKCVWLSSRDNLFLVCLANHDHLSSHGVAEDATDGRTWRQRLFRAAVIRSHEAAATAEEDRSTETIFKLGVRAVTAGEVKGDSAFFHPNIFSFCPARNKRKLSEGTRWKGNNNPNSEEY